ncbi:periodic tryptophan protein 2 homolog [Lineus longissimus]|uniref:periodic tryptophan protein 2 homolog n=1 Tax=Lineus longissimus TaxID=88925 RepID=UPI002B4F92BC
MKFSYRFSNLLGTVYRKGNLSFTPDGNSVVSPVGNRISIFDLKSNKSETLSAESSYNITAVGLSPDGSILIAVNEEGEALLCSLISKTVLHSYHFHGRVSAVSFSPDAKKFAVAKDNEILVFHAPGKTKEFNPFLPYKKFYGAYDETVSIDWTTDSQAFVVGSKDMNSRVYGSQRFENLIVYSVGGHSQAMVGAFFEENSLDFYSICERGTVCAWDCDTDLSDLRPYTEKEVAESSDEEGDEENNKQKKKESQENEEKQKGLPGGIRYRKHSKHNYREARGDGSAFAKVASVAFHKRSHILVTGFDDGGFFIHEMPDFNLIHSLTISDQSITSITFNNTGDWIALGCSGLGQLLVWEWQSESYILKQQGHFNNMSCLEYSPDGQYIATGGDDGKVKVWNTSSGFCFVTFSEHAGGITGVTFNQNGKVVASASMDGTVRAFDLNRYRNFRTFTSPRPAQFSCLALDHSGDIVCAGGMDVFEIFVWSMQTGRLLEVLAGHEGPVSSLMFSSSQALLASASWDKTIKLWDIFENKGARETLTFLSDVLAVAYRPDGNEIAVATLDAQVTFWDVRSASQTGTIEGRHDMGYSRKDTDKITAKKSAFGKAFTTLCYTADGKCILAGGRSKNVCIYSVEDKLLVKKFEISKNLSFDGTEAYLDRRKMTKWGNLDLVDTEVEDKSISLPGVKKGDMSSRHWKPEVRVSGVQFSPTGRAWAATTTEGLLIYSLDHNLVFDPFELEMDITPANLQKTLMEGSYSTALMLAFRLNEQRLIQEVVETIPVSDIAVVGQSIPDVYINKLLSFIASQMESSPHIEFYLTWAQKLLYMHGPKLKQRSQSIMAILRSLLKVITRRYEDIGKICDHNKYNLQFILALSQTQKKRKSEEELEKEEEEEPSDAEVDEIMGRLMESEGDDESVHSLVLS